MITLIPFPEAGSVGIHKRSSQIGKQSVYCIMVVFRIAVGLGHFLLQPLCYGEYLLKQRIGGYCADFVLHFFTILSRIISDKLIYNIIPYFFPYVNRKINFF